MMMPVPLRSRSLIIAIALAARSTSAFTATNARRKVAGWFPRVRKTFSKVTNVSLSSYTCTSPVALLSTSTSTLQTPTSDAWYSDPNLSRSDIPKVDEETLKLSRFVLLTSGERGATCHLHGMNESRDTAEPIFLSYQELSGIIGRGKLEEMASNEGSSQESMHDFLAWIGERDQYQYFAVYTNTQQAMGSLSDALGQHKGVEPAMLPLREFGDRLMESTDAAIHSTANGLIEFHKSHQFCSLCGSPTQVRKVGASRLCSNHKSLGGSCSSRSIYPRIDLASIMLITSDCNNYALLGRKGNWPSGRYSTLAGFLEVGETIEDCCIRETFEESGVRVDRSTVQFRKSQPWPFPRSLMVGFRAKAVATQSQSESDDGSTNTLPHIDFDEKEMEDVRWFEKKYVRERLEGGSTALIYEPTEEEMEFHIPGKASLARALITEWALED